MTTTRRGSTRNQGVSGPHPLRRSVYHYIRGNVEISFSIIQRKVLTPNDFADLDALRLRLASYEELSNQSPKPFQWKFDRAKLTTLLAKIEVRQRALTDTPFTCFKEAA